MCPSGACGDYFFCATLTKYSILSVPLSPVAPNFFIYFFYRINTFPSKAFVPLVKISFKKSHSERFCRPAVFVLKTSFQFGVHEKLELKQEFIQCPMDKQEPLCEEHHLT